jgi:hypothetical protein
LAFQCLRRRHHPSGLCRRALPRISSISLARSHMHSAEEFHVGKSRAAIRSCTSCSAMHMPAVACRRLPQCGRPAGFHRSLTDRTPVEALSKS